MKILILNWRSIKDLLAGGAELVTLEYAKRWVKRHQAKVTWISAPYNNKIRQETIDGINFEYVGLPLQRDKTLRMLVLFPIFYLLVFIRYLKEYKNKVDIIVDESHGFPFLSNLYSKEKVILYIHEYADVIWDKMFKFPINVIGKSIEKIILSLYRKNLTITGSNSTKEELILELKFLNKNIKVVNHALSIEVRENPAQKYKTFTLLFLNRVVKMKGPERALDIFKKVKELIPEAKLIIAGKYEQNYKNELDEFIKKNKIEDIEFKGFISEAEKINLLQKSHVLINTSYKEGWGLVNLEANSQGTPAVAFDVEGCRDSIKNGVNGYVAQDEKDFVQKILKLREINLEQESINYSKKFNYEDKAEEFWKVINE